MVALLDDAIRRRPRRIALAGFVCGLMLLCGHYQVVYIGLLGTGVFVVLDQLGTTGSGRFTQRAGKAVVVMACDDDILPLQDRIETVADETELDEVYETERHLFYVACTRARDRLLVSGVNPASEFFADLSANSKGNA